MREGMDDEHMMNYKILGAVLCFTVAGAAAVGINQAAGSNILKNQRVGIAAILDEDEDIGEETEFPLGRAGIAEILETEGEVAENGQEEGAEVDREPENESPAEPETHWGYTNLGIAKVDNHLNVREEGKEDAKLIGKMSKNTACEILSVEDKWARIKSGKVEGYVSTDYLYMGEEAIEKGREAASIVATVNTVTLKVREQPSTDSIVLTLVGQEEELEVEQVLEGWAQILLDDEVAFVSTDYVDIEEKLGTAVTMEELKYGQGVSNLRVDLVQFAKKHVGNPYVWGGTSLTKGADCSGFVQSVFKKFGVSMPRSSREQVNRGTKVSAAQAQPGDLYFYAKNGVVNHVAIYIGNGQVVHASSRKTGIKISNANYRTPFSIKRVLP